MYKIITRNIQGAGLVSAHLYIGQTQGLPLQVANALPSAVSGGASTRYISRIGRARRPAPTGRMAIEGYELAAGRGLSPAIDAALESLHEAARVPDVPFEAVAEADVACVRLF